MQWRRKGKTYTLHIVMPLKLENTYSGWLSSVKTVALKRDNTHDGINSCLFLHRLRMNGDEDIALADSLCQPPCIGDVADECV